MCIEEKGSSNEQEGKGERQETGKRKEPQTVCIRQQCVKQHSNLFMSPGRRYHQNLILWHLKMNHY